MNVCGYMHRLYQAAGNDKEVSLEQLSIAFKTHSSWDVLADPESELSKFLLLNGYTSLQEKFKGENGGISMFQMKVFGLVWCRGTSLEKAGEMFEMVQDNSKAEISCKDKDFKPLIQRMIMTVSLLVMHYAGIPPYENYYESLEEFG